MKLALIQMKGSDTNEKILPLPYRKLTKLLLQGADFVVLPEMFSCPYKASNFPVFAQMDGGLNWEKLSESAKKNKIYLVAGSMPELEIDRSHLNPVKKSIILPTFLTAMGRRLQSTAKCIFLTAIFLRHVFTKAKL